MKEKAPQLSEAFIEREMVFISSDPGETRTHGQWLKRPLLYQLSYRIKKYYYFPKKRWENYIFCNGIRKKNTKIFNGLNYLIEKIKYQINLIF